MKHKREVEEAVKLGRNVNSEDKWCKAYTK